MQVTASRTRFSRCRIEAPNAPQHETLARVDMPTIYDISLPLLNGGLVYPGNPEIRIEAQQSIANGNGANVSALSFGSHTGTHVDAPKHFFDAGAGVDTLPLDVLMGPAVLIC